MKYTMSYYSVLGLNEGESIENVKKRYKKLALKYHPDKNANSDYKEFQKIKEAYENIMSNKSNNTHSLYNTNFNTNTFNSIIGTFYSFYTYAMAVLNKNIELDIKVSLEDVYYHNIKKLVVKVKRNGTFAYIDLYISLISHTDVFIFEEMGDDFPFIIKGKKRSDVVIKVYVIDDPIVKYSNIVNKHDIYIDKYIDLYEYLYTSSFDVVFFQENINIEFEKKDKVFIINNKGLPYIEHGEIKRGDLYVYLHINIEPKNEMYMNDIKLKEAIYTSFSLK